MVPNSPPHALGNQADGVRDLMIDVVRSRHDRFAVAHEMSGSRYAMGFGAQWRDLLDDACAALNERGFQSHKLAPGGHKVGIVNGSVIYVWRVPEDPNAVKNFASSPTRQSGFVAPTPPAALWEPSFDDAVDAADAATTNVEPAETAALMAAVGDPMPLVLVMVHSVPWQLQKIEWAVAELDGEGKVELHGLDSIWEPELVAEDTVSTGEAFDHGSPVRVDLELRTREQPGTDA
ncbi:MAG: hypothetical protein DI573_13935 [Microbacterium sp.]|uniref:hypothetical protein n=1 Tax=Microbacterium sp. TaxID=51671 RepID=UPI000DB2C8C3|nr:hypothetical protein [Microbacterium sp.]PZU36310.1 MAG: hypothetical protein DI573_13935 [Microbacterium sp.]